MFKKTKSYLFKYYFLKNIISLYSISTTFYMLYCLCFSVKKGIVVHLLFAH